MSQYTSKVQLRLLDGSPHLAKGFQHEVRKELQGEVVLHPVDHICQLESPHSYCPNVDVRVDSGVVKAEFPGLRVGQLGNDLHG